MAIFDDFLEKYQKLVKTALEGDITAELNDSLEKSLDVLDLAINCHASIADQFKYQHLKWEKETRRLCDLRNSMMKLKKAHIPIEKETA